MRNRINGRFEKGNSFAKGFGRPRGGVRFMRDALAGRLPVEQWRSCVQADLRKAEQGNVKAALRVASVLRRLFFSDGQDLRRPWNAREARQARARQD